MALAYGTNCGFVTTAPTADPGGSAIDQDAFTNALKDTAPVGAITVTEIGWWCDNATEESNYEIGLYTHDAVNDRPGTLIAGHSHTNAKGTTSGWKVASGLNITITAGTIYWLAVQLDDTVKLVKSNKDVVTAFLFFYFMINENKEFKRLRFI
jgi:hypothetical protein